jgi:hypothetical protein
MAKVLRRFPLVPRPRPPCTPLTARAGRISDLAATAARDLDLTAASAAFNQAALLASDCGDADLARHWCHAHTEAYLQYCPLDAKSARYALEPLVNIARLHIRDGDGNTAYTLLDTLYQAIRDQIATVIDGIPVPVPRLTATAGALGALRTWLWTVLLADGPRAVISSGRWADALAHLERHHGIGQRMLDGRQVAVIAAYLAGDTDGVLTVLGDTATAEPWEEVVTACLTTLFAPDRPRLAQQRATVLDAYRCLGSAPELAVFMTRLGLTVIDAVGGWTNDAQDTVHDLITRVIGWQDGYAARDLLAYPACRALLTTEKERELSRITTSCALGAGTIPARIEAQLTAALDIAAQAVCHRLERSSTERMSVMLD